MAADIKSLQQQLMKENLDKYAEEGEKRTKLALAAIEGKADNMSATGKAYFEMLSKVVEASEKATGKQLEYSADKINDISKTIQQASDLNDVERDLLQAQVQTVQDTFKANTQNGSTLVSMAKKTLEDNAVDVTSIVAGLTSNNPVIMFATKWIGDSIKQRREEAKAQMQTIDEAMASVDTTLIAQREDNADWREAQDSQAFAEEENRREEARAREDQTEALEAIANKEFDVNVESADGDGGFWDNILGMMGIKGGMKGLAAMGSQFAPALAAALPIASIAGGVAMSVKDGFDIYSNLADDDIATGIEGSDVGAVAGSAIGGAIGFALGGPLGAGIGAMIGNIVGEFIGDILDPDMDEVAQETANQIKDRQQALVDTMNVLEQQLANGTLSQEQYNAARAEMQAEIDKVNAQALANDRVFELQAARDRAAQNYNDLNAQIEKMEEAGIAVPDAMYDQLAVAEQSFYDAETAFETAADELNSQVDPSWWDTLSATVSTAVSNVTTSVDNAFESVRNSLTGLAIPDIEGMSEDERAALQAKVNALPEGLESVAGLTQEQLVLLAEDLEISPEDLAAMDSAAVLRATAMDSAVDGLKNAGQFAQDKISEIGTSLWSFAEKAGVDDEITAVGEQIGLLVDEVTSGAREYWTKTKEKFASAKDTVLSWFGWGNEEQEQISTQEQLESIREQKAALQAEITAANDRIARSEGGENVYFGRETVGRREDAEAIAQAEAAFAELAIQESELTTGESRMPDLGGNIEDDVVEIANQTPTTGMTLNATQAEIQDGRAEENIANATGGANGGNVNMITQNNSSQSVQRVQPVIPVRNSSDDYRGSAIPAN
jgi:outer membrane lipoprotein SlyB